MRGSAAPTSPGAWDARSEALLGAPALTATEPLVPGGAAPRGTAPTSVPPPPPGTAWTPAPAAGAQTPPGADHPAPRSAPAGGTAPVHRTAPQSTTAPAAPSAARARSRRGNADPVKALVHRHRELCERAVDPLEVAAGLEARGFTDRTAARFRHRDVFSLAEELYARVPRRPEKAARPARPGTPTRPWALAVLAPGAVAGLTGLGLALAQGPVRPLLGVAGALALGAALLFAVSRGPLRVPDGRTVPAARLWTLWLLVYAVGGDGLLERVLNGGPDGTWQLAPAPLLGLALAVAPAAWCAHLFASRARRRITDSRGLAAFAAAVRPLFLGTVALQLLALTALLALTRFSAGALALGALLLLARLLAVHGRPETAAVALVAACAAEALALASALAGGIPLAGFEVLDAPVRSLTGLWGAGAVPTLACGAAALCLLARATGALARASAHTAP
ncbi:hypothetical protein [Streptomyces sp. NPDC058872]|uniref:hypothetical protein n=1 Tax=Streptomyces sp. NPDC058872 TaxID=3346661 RepID=UPI003690D250